MSYDFEVYSKSQKDHVFNYHFISFGDRMRDIFANDIQTIEIVSL